MAKQESPDNDKLLEIIMLNTQNNKLIWKESASSKEKVEYTTYTKSKIRLRFEGFKKRWLGIIPRYDSLFLKKEGDEFPEKLLFDTDEMPDGLKNLCAIIAKQQEMRSMDRLVDEAYTWLIAQKDATKTVLSGK